MRPLLFLCAGQYCSCFPGLKRPANSGAFAGSGCIAARTGFSSDVKMPVNRERLDNYIEEFIKEYPEYKADFFSNK